MKIYHYNKITKEYIKESDARRDPKEKKETYLIPANATIIKPKKENNNLVNVFNGSDWDQLEDNRDKKIYNINNGQEYSVDILGEIPSEFTLIKPSEELIKPIFKNNKWEETAVVYKGKEITSEEDIREYNMRLLMIPDNMEALVGAVAALATGGEVPAKFFHALQEVADATKEAKDLLIANNMKDR